MFVMSLPPLQSNGQIGAKERLDWNSKALTINRMHLTATSQALLFTDLLYNLMWDLRELPQLPTEINYELYLSG